MPTSFAAPAPALLDYLASLPPGTIVAQLDDGSLAICSDLEEADRRMAASARRPNRGSRARQKTQEVGSAN